MALAAAGVVIVCLEWGGGVWSRVGGFDLHTLYIPKYEAVVRALFHEGRLPLWNPFEFCGLPLLGISHAAALYAPMWMTFGLLPPYLALQAFYALHVVILALGAVVYLRRHGTPAWAAAVVPAVATAGLISDFGYNGYDHPSFLASVAWLPWMLLVVEEGTRSGLRPWAGILALLVAGQWFAGYPDFPLDTAVLLSVFALVAGGRTWTRALAMVVIGFALGSLVAAAQLLPLSDALAESARSDQSVPFAAGREVFAVASAGQLVSDLVARQGVVVLIVAILGATQRGRVVVAWLAALVWALFALNRPFVWLYQLPGFAGIRFPFGWSGLGPVFLACLAASGLAAIAAARPWARPIAFVLALAILGESARIIVDVPDRLPKRGPDAAQIEKRMQVVWELAGSRLDTERFLSPIDALAGAALRYRMPSPMGWEPSLAPRRVERLLQFAGLGGGGARQASAWKPVARRAPIVNLLGVGPVVVSKDAAVSMWLAHFRLLGVVPPDDAVLHEPGIPRARLVHRKEVVWSEDAAFEKVVKHAEDAPRVVVLEAPDPSPIVVDVPAGVTEGVAIVESRSEWVAIEVDAAQPGVLVLTDTYYRGWEATLDGQRTPILRADYAFRGVAVPRGSHRVEFRYRPPSVWLGILVSAVGFLIVVAVLRSRRASSPV